MQYPGVETWMGNVGPRDAGMLIVLGAYSLYLKRFKIRPSLGVEKPSRHPPVTTGLSQPAQEVRRRRTPLSQAQCWAGPSCLTGGVV